MIRIFYNFAIHAFGFVVYLLSPFKPKIKKRIIGLRGPKAKLNKNTILFHCASAGEFEQVYPVIQNIQNHNSKFHIAISFFSASGMDWLERKNIDLHCFYLPLDTSIKMKKFISSYEPEAIVIVKNEFWFNFFKETLNNNIPLFLIATAFKKNHFVLKYPFFTSILNRCEHIFTLDEMSQRFAEKKLTNASLAGDPRIDRIIQVAHQAKLPALFNREYDKKICIYASVHREDIDLINLSIQNSNMLHIVVPHEVNEKEISYFKEKINKKTSLLNSITKWDNDILIVDTTGILASIYQCTNYCYIGGGFGDGIHNILEPAIFNNIIFIGPKNEHFPEARILKNRKAIIEITKSSNIQSIIAQITPNESEKMMSSMKTFFNNHKGSSNKISDKIIQQL